MWRLLPALCCLALIGCEPPVSAPVDPGASLKPADIKSGTHFLTPETQSLQADEFANPGYLWVDQGEALFERADDETPSCQSCHQDALKGRAARFPKLDPATGKLVNLEGQINLCRNRHQDLPALDYESEDLLSLTAYIARQSQGMPTHVSVDGAARQYFEAGQSYFFTRRGQFNLSCAQCHSASWGTQLRGDTISQGHLNGFPAYRLEWQGLGSSHRRLRDCDTGVRAEPLPFGDDIYFAVELYLAHRSRGLAMESPAIRR